MRSGPTVSATLIVYNDELVLQQCLESFKESVDEIIVVDTGSTDATQAIASRYTEQVFELAWERNFGSARQFALEQATSDWVLWIDADDIVCNAEALPTLLSRTSPNTGVIFLPYVVNRDAAGNPSSEFWRERLVRNEDDTAWHGRVYEVLTAGGGADYRPDIVIERQPVRSEDRLRRTIEVAEIVRREEGDTPRLLYHLARDYIASGDTSRALEALQSHVGIAQWDDEKYQAQVRVAELLRRVERYETALDADLAALKIHPTWPDAYFGLAKTYYFLQDWPKVVHWSEMGEMLAEPETAVAIDTMDYRFNWIIYYTNALYRVGRVDEALEWTREALTVRPEDPWHKENETFFSGLLGESPQSAASMD